MPEKIKISIIVPVFGDGFEPILFVQEIQRELIGVSGFEVVFVNDNFPDNNWEKIKSCIEKFPFVKGVCFSKTSDNIELSMLVFKEQMEITTLLWIVMDRMILLKLKTFYIF